MSSADNNGMKAIATGKQLLICFFAARSDQNGCSSRQLRTLLMWAISVFGMYRCTSWLGSISIMLSVACSPIDFLTRLCAAEPFATVCENTARLGHFVCVITACARSLLCRFAWETLLQVTYYNPF